MRSALAPIVPTAYRPTAIWKRRVINLGQTRGVLSGPFAGLALRPDETYIPRIIGSYEKELHPAIEALIAWNPHTVLDAGAETGYYAAGLAMRLPRAHIVASEIEERYHPAIAEGCRVNGALDRVSILGATDTRLLNEAILPGSAIVCDIEGHERHVIDPVKVPALKGAALLIELHEHYEPGVSALLKNRLAET